MNKRKRKTDVMQRAGSLLGKFGNREEKVRYFKVEAAFLTI